MRTDEEFIKAMHRRAADIRREERERHARIAGLGARLGGLAAVIMLALVMPSFETKFLSVESSARASLFAVSGVLGYIVIGVTAFMLGAAVTILCYRLRKNNDDEDGEL